MLQHRLPRAHAPLLLFLGVMLGSFVFGAFNGSSSHSLCYSYLQLSEPSQNLPQTFIRGYLDNQTIARYDSLTRNMTPLVPWIEEKEEEMFQVLQSVFGANLENLTELCHHTRGLHTWQVNLGCELREDGSKRCFLHYGNDGRDFISFDTETLRWEAAQPLAEKVKQMWKEDPSWSRRNKGFLEKICIGRLQKYLSYKKKAPQRKEPPVGKVTHKATIDSLETLICQVYGFYPKEIQASWTKDGEIWEHETLHRNVTPNSDGTYYVWLSVEVDPKERHRFRCLLEHESLQEPLILAFKEETARTWWIPLGIVAATILGFCILFLRCQWQKCKKHFYRKVTFGPDHAFSSPPIYGTEDEIQL